MLVAQRLDQQIDAWQMPQGGILKNETPEHAALRELKEEIGTSHVTVLAESKTWYKYDLPQHLAIKVWRGKYRGQIQKWFAMEFLGKDSSINPSSVEQPEFNEWRWVDIEILPSLAIDFKKEIYEAISMEFSQLALNLRTKKCY